MRLGLITKALNESINFFLIAQVKILNATFNLAHNAQAIAFFSDGNDENCHNCYFREQTCEVESEMGQTTFLARAERETRPGAESPM